MARRKLPTTQRQCARPGCGKVFEVRIGAKYQKRYCCPRCAALATSESRKHRKRKRRFPVSTERELKKQVFSIIDLQNLPISFEKDNGGRFVEVCNGILSGELVLVGI